MLEVCTAGYVQGTQTQPVPPSPPHKPDLRSGPPRRLARSARSWNKRVQNVEDLAATAGFQQLQREIIALAGLGPDDTVLDLGAGGGLLTIAAAPTVRQVTALDISPAICRHLQDKLTAAGIGNVDVIASDATSLPLADRSLDVVISNYCLHHLTDPDKQRALQEVLRVLRPGGRVVIGDMMFRVGVASARDRALIGQFVARMLRRGPAGVWRLLKNGVRLLTGRAEHPASVDWWRQALTDLGFDDVQVRGLAHEGGVASARVP